MSDILERILSVDPLAIAVLAGSFLFLWAIWRVLLDDVDFGATREDESSEKPTEGEPAPPVGAGKPRHKRPR